MSIELIILLFVGSFVGGFINGLTGFGTALLSLGIWLQVLPPWQAISIVAGMSVASGLLNVALQKVGQLKIHLHTFSGTSNLFWGRSTLVY